MYNDEWCKNKSFTVEYIDENINTRTDAEYFESHYIALYETDKYYNIKKSGWGTSSYLPERHDWTSYTFSKDTLNDAELDSDYIYKVIYKSKKCCFEIKKLNVKSCVCKRKKSVEDVHCKECGSNDVYINTTYNKPRLHCRVCDSCIRKPIKKELAFYNPQYIGEYKKNNGAIEEYEYFVVNRNENFEGKDIGVVKTGGYYGELYLYLLNLDNIEQIKQTIIDHKVSIANKNIERWNKEISECERRINDAKRYIKKSYSEINLIDSSLDNVVINICT